MARRLVESSVRFVQVLPPLDPSFQPWDNHSKLNSEFLYAQSDRLAARISELAGPEIEQRVKLGFQIVFARQPTESELAKSITFLKKQEQGYLSKNDPRLRGAIHSSDDNGKTWRLLSTLSREGDTGDLAEGDSAGPGNIDEPAIAILPDGRLFLITRPDGGYFFSEDEGQSWKPAGRLVTQGKFKAPRLFVLKDGTIVCVCTYRNLQVFIGTNGGKDWSGPFDLDSTSYGYPGGLMLDDESMLVSYCSSGGAPNRIYLLRFRLNRARTGVEFLPIGE